MNATTVRTYRDREDMAIAAAQQLAGRRGNDRGGCATVTVKANGRVDR